MLVEQVYIFGWSILTGILLGILFDLFRGLRWEGTKDIWVYIQDIIFWVISGVIIIVSAFLMNKGEIRGYMLIGYLLGAGFYMLLFSKYILGTFKFINGKIRNAFKMIFQTIRKLFQSTKKTTNGSDKNVQAKAVKKLSS